MSGLPVFVLSILCVAPRAAGHSPGDALGNAPSDETSKGKISEVWVLNATRKWKRSHPSGSLLLLGASELLLFLFSWFFWKLQPVWCWSKSKVWGSLWAETADAPPTSELPGLPSERKEQRVLMDLCEILQIFSQQIWSNTNQTAEEAIKESEIWLSMCYI